MVDPEWGIENLTKADDVKTICKRVADGYQRDLDKNPLSDEDAEALAWAARAAWPARAAWDAWAARAAWAAWDARAARAARDAWAARPARAAWAAWAAWDARDAFIIASSDELIHLLETAPILELSK
jgi:hypothetical protein